MGANLFISELGNPQLCWGTNSKTKPAISASDKSYHPQNGDTT